MFPGAQRLSLSGGLLFGIVFTGESVGKKSVVVWKYISAGRDKFGESAAGRFIYTGDVRVLWPEICFFDEV